MTLIQTNFRLKRPQSVNDKKRKAVQPGVVPTQPMEGVN